MNYPSIKKIKQQKKVTFMRAHKEDSLGHQPFQDISSLFHLKKKKKKLETLFPFSNKIRPALLMHSEKLRSPKLELQGFQKYSR